MRLITRALILAITAYLKGKRAKLTFLVVMMAPKAALRVLLSELKSRWCAKILRRE